MESAPSQHGGGMAGREWEEHTVMSSTERGWVRTDLQHEGASPEGDRGASDGWKH